MTPLVLLAVGAVLAAATVVVSYALAARAGRVRTQRLLARGGTVVGVVVLAAGLLLGPVRFNTVAENAPRGPGGRQPLAAPVEEAEVLVDEVAELEASRPGARPRLTLTDVEVLGRITGPGGVNDTGARWNVHATDLGHFIQHRGRLHLVFGDTFGPGGFGGRDWRSNVMAVASPGEIRLPFDQMISDRPGHAAELIPSKKVDGLEKTVIPTFGTAVGGRLFLHYMSVRTWQGPGRWVVNHSGLAFSDDGGRTWTVDRGMTWPGGSNFAQVAFVKHEGFVYLFGIPEGRFGPVQLARVRPRALLNPRAYRYWNGQRWTPDPAAAATVVPAPVGELSVVWSRRHQQWLMLYLDEPRKGIVLRTAPSLTGPWSEPELVVSAADYPALYAPFIVPGSPRGDELRFTMSQWGPYNVYVLRARITPLPAEPVG